MERSISVERVYNLGDYKSLRITEVANNIPEDLSLDHEFMTGLRKLQLLEIEKAYYAYAILAKDMMASHSTDEERLVTLEEYSNSVFTHLLERYTNIQKTEK